jgi:glycine/D-amino acid oxidase-like deaminating enzyme
MIRHTPFWLDRYPKSRRPSYPRHRGPADAGVVIVGGGLTGAACAWTFASAGVQTVLLEADRIGSGSTAAAAGLVREDFDATFQETASAYGLRAARLLWQGMRRASLDFAAALRRLEIRCDLSHQDLLLVARGPEDGKRLRKDYQARRDAGLGHSWLTPRAVEREAALSAAGAIRTRGGALDPYRACVGLIAGAAARGAAVFERSPVTRIRVRSKHVEVTTNGGVVRAGAVVIATAAPLADLRSLRRHFRNEQGYAVVTEPLPAAVRRQLGQRAAAIRDTAPTPHFLRWLKDDRVLFAGADQAPVPVRARERTIVQRTGQLMYELSVLYPAISGALPEWSWDFGHHSSVDGLPCIGVHRNFPRHLFALGHGRHGVGTAWLAARLLLRHYHGELEKGDELFGFVRLLG